MPEENVLTPLYPRGHLLAKYGGTMESYPTIESLVRRADAKLLKPPHDR